MESAGEYDYVIVGAGMAGCLLANRLTRRPDIGVLLIEAGGKDDYLWIHIPVGYLYCIDNPRTDWLFRTEADPGLGGRALLYPRGKVLGGSSSINGMIYMRGQAGDYARWAACTGDPSWHWDAVLPIFKRSEDHYLGASAIHGRGGEWRVEHQRLSWEILDAFRTAAAENGIPAITDFNGGDNAGCAYFEVNQRRGIRLNTAKAFLRPAAKRPNLTIMTGCHVEQLLLEDTEQGRSVAAYASAAMAACSRRRRGATPCWPPARSARRTSCSCRASARPRTCTPTASNAPTLMIAEKAAQAILDAAR